MINSGEKCKQRLFLVQVFNESCLKDLLATKDIYALPVPRHDVPLMDPRPQKVLRPEPIPQAKTDNIDEMLEDYRRHWKNVKKR